MPSEAKSAFALEMDDVRVMMRDCTHKSLVMIDELGECEVLVWGKFFLVLCVAVCGVSVFKYSIFVFDGIC